MKTLLILLTLFLTACESTTTVEQINEAISLCEANGGLEHILKPGEDYITYSYCNNGARFRTETKD